MSVTRHNAGGFMPIDSNGRWVTYENYAHLEEAMGALRAELASAKEVSEGAYDGLLQSTSKVHALQAERDRLREALKAISHRCNGDSSGKAFKAMCDMDQIARKALEGVES